MVSLTFAGQHSSDFLFFISSVVTSKYMSNATRVIFFLQVARRAINSPHGVLVFVYVKKGCENKTVGLAYSRP